MDCSAVGLSDAAIQKKAPTVCRGFKGREKAQRESLGTPRIVQTLSRTTKKELRATAIAFSYRALSTGCIAHAHRMHFQAQ